MEGPRSDETESHEAEQGVELSSADLSPEALRGLVEEFVSREGTDYGHVDRRQQLEAGEG